MLKAEMIEELRRTAIGNRGAIGFKLQGTPPRKVAELLAKTLREQKGPFVATTGVYRAEEREQLAAALDSGELDASIAEILSELNT